MTRKPVKSAARRRKSDDAEPTQSASLRPRNVAMFVTCLVDLFRPSVGFAITEIPLRPAFDIRLAGAIGFVSADAIGDAFDLFHVERRLALGLVPREQCGLDLGGVHADLAQIAAQTHQRVVAVPLGNHIALID